MLLAFVGVAPEVRGRKELLCPSHHHWKQVISSLALNRENLWQAVPLASPYGPQGRTQVSGDTAGGGDG